MPIVIGIQGGAFMRDWRREHPNVQLYQALDDMAEYIKGYAETMAPGRTKLAIDVNKERIHGRWPQIEVGLRREPKFAVFVHEGTGVFGPLHKPIFASKGNVFAFHKEGKLKFRTRIRGQRAQPFLRDAVIAAEASYIPVRVRQLGAEVS